MPTLVTGSKASTGYSGASVASPQTFSPPVTYPAGSKAFVAIYVGRSSIGATPTLSDNSTQAGTANTWTLVTARRTSTNISLAVFYCDVTRDVLSTDLFSAVWSGGTAAFAADMEAWTGCATGAPDAVGAANTIGNPTAGALGAATVGDLIIGWFAWSVATAFTAGTDGQGNTMTTLNTPTPASFKGGGSQYEIAPGTAAYNPTNTSVSGNTWAAVGIRVASSGSTRALTVAAPSATSGMSASPTRIRGLAPAVAATSAAAASIARTRRLVPTAAATSVVAAGLSYRYTFPISGVIDNFDRSTGLGSSWTTPIFSPLSALRISGNLLESSSTGAAANGYWSDQQFGPDIEVYATIASQPLDGSDHPRLYLKMTNPGTTLNGYRIARSYSAAGTDGVTVSRYDAGTLTTLLTLSQDFNAGDKIGARMLGSILTVYRWDVSTGIWVSLGSVTDSTYLGNGYIGVQVSLSNAGHTQAQVDDFGGGSVSTSIFANMAATSSVTGSIGRIRPYTASISAVSPVSASVGRIRPLVLASVTSTSTVVARPGRVANVMPATVSATSAVTISPLVHVWKISVTIAATSDASTSIQHALISRQPIDPLVATSNVTVGAAPPITLRATSNMSAHVAAVTIFKATIGIAATSNATASLVRIHHIAPALQARSDVTVSIARQRAPLFVIAATSTVTAAPSRGRPISVSVTANSDVTASLSAGRTLVVTAQATSLVTANFGRVRTLSPTAVATSNVVADVTEFRYIAGTVVATSLISAAVGRIRHPLASIVASSGLTVAPGAIRRLAATMSASSLVVAFVFRMNAITPIAVGTSAVTASIVRLRSRAVSVVALSDLTVSPTRLRGLSPIVTSTSTVNISLARQRSLSTTLTGNSAITVSMHALRGVSPLITATSDLAASLIFTRAIHPMITATSDTLATVTFVTTAPLTDKVNHLLLAADFDQPHILSAGGL